jgi:hypothetical protein
MDFYVETGGKYGVSNFAEMIIPVESDNPYEYDYFRNSFLPNKKEPANADIIQKKEIIWVILLKKAL